MGDPEGPLWEPPGPLVGPPVCPPGSPERRPRLWLHRGRVLVWAPAAARALRQRHRVWGIPVGAPARGGRGGGRERPRIPLQLLPEEARTVVESGAAELTEQLEDAVGQQETDRTPRAPPDLSQPSLQWPHGGCPGHEQRLRIYRDLWGRGLQLTPGGKFGGDFLVYPGSPTQMHAAAVALCPTGRVGLSLGALVAAARLGTHVKKSLLIGSSCTEEGGPSRGPAYISLQWRSDL